MIELYGTDACPDCKIAKMLFEKYDIEYKWIDIFQNEEFNDEIQIPMVKLDDGTVLVGVGNIKKLLLSMGIGV
jgi:glutaredoxin-related protein